MTWLEVCLLERAGITTSRGVGFETRSVAFGTTVLFSACWRTHTHTHTHTHTMECAVLFGKLVFFCVCFCCRLSFFVGCWTMGLHRHMTDETQGIAAILLLFKRNSAQRKISFFFSLFQSPRRCGADRSQCVCFHRSNVQFCCMGKTRQNRLTWRDRPLAPL